MTQEDPTAASERGRAQSSDGRCPEASTVVTIRSTDRCALHLQQTAFVIQNFILHLRASEEPNTPKYCLQIFPPTWSKLEPSV